jgi:hypothetical protein
MTLATDEFIRRFLIHVLPKGFHRIRHYGLLARGACVDNVARARKLLVVSDRENERMSRPRPSATPTSHPVHAAAAA